MVGVGGASNMSKSLAAAIADFGRAATSKLSAPVISGEPEDQLRGPLETLIMSDIAALCGYPPNAVIMIGETLLAEDSTFYGDLFAHVVKWQGDLYLEDGLHRAVRAALQQRQVLHARVLEMD